jgi:hypothetical protein
MMFRIHGHPEKVLEGSAADPSGESARLLIVRRDHVTPFWLVARHCVQYRLGNLVGLLQLSVAELGLQQQI